MVGQRAVDEFAFCTGARNARVGQILRSCLNLKTLWFFLLTRCLDSKIEVKMNINVQFDVQFQEFDLRVPMSPQCDIIAAAGLIGFCINTICLSCVRSGQVRSAIFKTHISFTFR